MRLKATKINFAAFSYAAYAMLFIRIATAKVFQKVFPLLYNEKAAL